MRCASYAAGRCRSCGLIEQPYADQLAAKQQHCRTALGDPAGLQWLPPVPSAPFGFRTKAKMVVAGTVDAPTLGILDEAGRGVDLRECPLYPPAITDALPVLAGFVTTAGLTPYDVPARHGELKHLLVTAAPDGRLLVRFVLRSTEALARIRKHLPALQAALPALAVASVNVQPEHKAVVEGEREILLTEAATLTMTVNGIDLRLRPQGFVQTNTEVAAALYRQAAAWVDEAAPATVWDLYCGVGGFALHVAAPGRAVVGVEIAAEAVAAARASADDLARARAAAGLDPLGPVRFLAGDATELVTSGPAPSSELSAPPDLTTPPGLTTPSGLTTPPDLVIVNPPRRGLGPRLSGWLEDSGVRDVVYSSCHSGSLARDLAAMPSLRPVRARVLDMFPQTDHYEVVVHLRRADVR